MNDQTYPLALYIDSYVGSTKSKLYTVSGFGRAPTLGNQALSTNIVVEEVHCVVDGFFLHTTTTTTTTTTTVDNLCQCEPLTICPCSHYG
jgi:hypothetical protein